MDPRLLRAALIVVLVLPLLVLPLSSTAQPTAPLVAADSRPDQLVLQPSQDPALASGNDYLSPPTQAAHPFTHMLLRREAHVPEGAALTLAVRASSDGQSWSPWSDL